MSSRDICLLTRTWTSMQSQAHLLLVCLLPNEHDLSLRTVWTEAANERNNHSTQMLTFSPGSSIARWTSSWDTNLSSGIETANEVEKSDSSSRFKAYTISCYIHHHVKIHIFLAAVISPETDAFLLRREYVCQIPRGRQFRHRDVQTWHICLHHNHAKSGQKIVMTQIRQDSFK